MKITNRQTIELFFKSLVNRTCLNKEAYVFHIGGREITAIEVSGIFHVLDLQTDEWILSISQDGEVDVHGASDWLNEVNCHVELKEV